MRSQDSNCSRSGWVLTRTNAEFGSVAAERLVSPARVYTMADLREGLVAMQFHRDDDGAVVMSGVIPGVGIEIVLDKQQLDWLVQLASEAAYRIEMEEIVNEPQIPKDTNPV